MLAALIALAVTLLGLAGSAYWYGVARRRSSEIQLGIQALAKIKWRQCIALILETLQRDGYTAATRDQASDESTDFLLHRQGEKVLLSYKHGTAYQISGTDIRDFGNRLSLKGATRGLLITLGQSDARAQPLASRLGIQVFDGATLWAMLRPYLPESIVDNVNREANALSNKGLWTGGFASLAAGLLVFIIGLMVFTPNSRTTAGADALSHQPSVAAIPTGPELTARKQLDEARKALDEIASLTDQDRARRRAEAAKQIAAIMQVRSAAWSAQSTLLVTLTQSDGKDKDMLNESCRILIRYEELRYSRLQIEPPPDTVQPVRWHQCN